jgi:serine protease Do
MRARYRQPLIRLISSGLAFVLVAAGPTPARASLADVVPTVQPKLVKIYGAGGLRGLEAYQSGLLISADGHVLTVLSYVLDSDLVTVTLGDGRRTAAKMVGADPVLEIAVLKVDESGLPYFRLASGVTADRATPVLAFSNLFGIAAGREPLSVMHGWITVRTTLAARRGAYATPYQGPVYILDAITSNPGAAGGALTNVHGQLLGMLGKELQHKDNRTWLNYALPVHEIAVAVGDILAGRKRPAARQDVQLAERPVALATLGVELVPDVLASTPPFIDAVATGSPAAAAGLIADDLVVYLNGQLVRTCKQLHAALMAIEQDEPVGLTVLRDQELIEVVLRAPGP